MSRMALSHNRVIRGVAALVLAAVVASVVACGSDSNGPRDDSGTYSLTTVDGSTLPFTVPDTPNHTIVLNSATTTLNPDHTYTISADGVEDGADPATVIADHGTYSVSGSTVTFVSALSIESYTAAATTNALTFTVPGSFAGSSDASFTLLFEKAN